MFHKGMFLILAIAVLHYGFCMKLTKKKKIVYLIQVINAAIFVNRADKN